MKSSGDLNFHDIEEKEFLLKNWGGRRMLPRNILAMLLIIFPAGTLRSTKKNERKGQSETTVGEVKNYSKIHLFE